MNLYSRASSIIFIALLWAADPLFSQISRPKTFGLSSSEYPETPLPPSNSVSHIETEGTTIWLGTSNGVGKSIDGARSWQLFRGDPAFSNDGIFSIAVSAETVWTSTGFEKDLDEGSVQTGSGYAFSTNGGTDWHHIPQTLDERGDSIISYGINDSLWILPVVVPEQNVTFDVALSPGTVWIASWASGLRKSTDNGQTWQRIILPFDSRNSITPQDTLWSYASSDTMHLRRIFSRFDPRRNNNFLAFSVLAIDSDTIWCGTAGGVNKSTDGGLSWTKFSHRNQSAPIMGNWVIAIDEQPLADHRRIWITNWKAEDLDEQFGVSYTDDGGRSWTNLLHGVRAYDFAFKDSVAYIAAEDGIYRTSDGGLSFVKISRIVDSENRRTIGSASVFSVGVFGDTVLVGTSDGIALTIDNATHLFGELWTIRQTYQPLRSPEDSYAYPNPFNPRFEGTRLHYAAPAGGGSQSEISIQIFDFGMNRVRTLINKASRSPGAEHDEYWDGTNDDGRLVANGVYFYRIETTSGEPKFGKILVLQ